MQIPYVCTYINLTCIINLYRKYTSVGKYSALITIRDRSHWFGIESLRPCVPVDIEAYEFVPIGLVMLVCVLVSLLTLKPMRFCLYFDIDSLGVVPGLIRV